MWSLPSKEKCSTVPAGINIPAPDKLLLVVMEIRAGAVSLATLTLRTALPSVFDTFTITDDAVVVTTTEAPVCFDSIMFLFGGPVLSLHLVIY
jgi:hypothetical protein